MVANIRATRDVAVHELTKKGAIRKTLFVREVSMFLSVLKRALFLIQGRDNFGREGDGLANAMIIESN